MVSEGLTEIVAVCRMLMRVNPYGACPWYFVPVAALRIGCEVCLVSVSRPPSTKHGDIACVFLKYAIIPKRLFVGTLYLLQL